MSSHSPEQKPEQEPQRSEQPQQTEHSQDTSSDSDDSVSDKVYTPIFETGETELFSGKTELSEEVSTPPCWSASGNLLTVRYLQFIMEFTRHTRPNGVKWGIASNPSRSGEGSPTPFYHDTVEQIYEYWRANFIDDTLYKGTMNKPIRYTTFTFIVVDDRCIESDPWEIIVACDAPDYGEADGEMKVKYFRMPFKEAARCLNSLEYLTKTPSEAENRSNDVLSGFPPPCMMPVRDENGNFTGNLRFATREEAIKNKRRMLA